MEGFKFNVVNKFHKYFGPDRASSYTAGNTTGEGDDDKDGVGIGAGAIELEEGGDRSSHNFTQRLFERISPYKQVSTSDEQERGFGSHQSYNSRLIRSVLDK